MDYLPQPYDPIRSKDEVPCYSTTDYDGGDFDTYPIRAGWGPRPVSEWQHIFRSRPTAFMSFLQTWLFFAPLEILLGHAISAADYTRQTPDGVSVLSTARLLPTLRAWIASGGAVSFARSADRKNALLRAHTAQFGFGGVAATLVAAEGDIPLQTFVYSCSYADPRDARFTVAVNLLHEFLLGVAFHANRCVLGNKSIPEGAPALPPLDDPCEIAITGTFQAWKSLVFLQMRKDGWCPSELSVLLFRLNCAGMYFLSFVQRPNSSLEHLMNRLPASSGIAALLDEGVVDLSLGPSDSSDTPTCTDSTCPLLQLDKHTYRTKHVEGCKGCHDMVADEEEIYSMLKRGNFPLICAISPEHNGSKNTSTIKLAESGPDIPYVAISHVWSDGLGNVQRSALPYCQVLRISNLIRSLPGPSPSSRFTLFWIDTIGCPSLKPAKSLAIAKMRETYARSTATLVLDAWLQSVPLSPLTEAEILLRIVASPWNSRLWTLQEGALPSTLYFRFEDTAYNVDHGLRDLNKLEDITIEYTLKSPINHRLREVRGYKYVQEQSVPQKIMAVIRALSFRTTSVATDEPICLATLLDLDVLRIATAPKEERMLEFWKMLSASPLPAALLFHQRPRLKTPGFRWAPNTLLRLEDHAVVMNEDVAAGKAALWIPARGLLVRYSGYVLETGSCVLGPVFHFKAENDGPEAGGTWYRAELQTKYAEGAVLYEEHVGPDGKKIEIYGVNPAESYGADAVGFISNRHDEDEPDVGPAPGDRDFGVFVAVTERAVDDSGIIFAGFLCNGFCTRLVPGHHDSELALLQADGWRVAERQDEITGLRKGEEAEKAYYLESVDHRSHERVNYVKAHKVSIEQYWCID